MVRRKERNPKKKKPTGWVFTKVVGGREVQLRKRTDIRRTELMARNKPVGRGEGRHKKNKA